MSPNLASNIPGISFFIPFCQKPRVLEWSLKVEPAWLAHRSVWASGWIIHLIQPEKADHIESLPTDPHCWQPRKGKSIFVAQCLGPMKRCFLWKEIQLLKYYMHLVDTATKSTENQ